jgi:hypothetical protein
MFTSGQNSSTRLWRTSTIRSKWLFSIKNTSLYWYIKCARCSYTMCSVQLRWKWTMQNLCQSIDQMKEKFSSQINVNLHISDTDTSWKSNQMMKNINSMLYSALSNWFAKFVTVAQVFFVRFLPYSTVKQNSKLRLFLIDAFLSLFILLNRIKITPPNIRRKIIKTSPNVKVSPSKRNPGRQIRHVYGEATSKNTVIRNHRSG